MDIISVLTGHRIIVDKRWVGEHGIGRFAAEVISRLNPDWETLEGRSPTSPTDVLNPRRFELNSHDLVYSPGFNAGFTRARQLLTLHDLIHLEGRSAGSLARILFYSTIVRSAILRAGVVMTVSECSATAIREWLNAPKVQIVNVGNGRSAAFVPIGESTKFFRPTFIYVGNMKSHKNVETILDALRLRPQFDLLIVTANTAEANSAVAHRNLDDQVSVVTGISDAVLAQHYRGAIGSLQPSTLEGFGLPALEAMSCGTRVAFWRGCASVAEICAGSGIPVTIATDAHEWASAMDTLLKSPDRLSMPESWNSKYDWSLVAQNVERVLNVK